MDQLNEGCVCRVFLLNGEALEIVLNKKHTVNDILTLANRQCELPISSWPHFGLAYIDEKQQIVWLSSEDYINQIPFPKCVSEFSEVKLHHFVRFFPLNFATVTDAVTLLYYFYDTRIQFLKGYLIQSLEDFVYCCAALIILSNGQLNLDTDEIADIFNDQIRPSIKLLRTFEATLDEIYIMVHDEIRRLRCSSQGNLVMLFMKHAERSTTFGSAFYSVSDTQQRQLTLAVNSRSIVQFDAANVYQPKKIFNLNQVDNIFWKENVFTIHVRTHHSPEKASNSHLNGMQTMPNRSLQKHAFVCNSVQQCKMIWCAAVEQHRYHMEQRILNNQIDSSNTQRLADQLEELFTCSTKLASLASSSSIDSYSTISRSSMPPSSIRLGTLSSTSLVGQSGCVTAEEKQKIAETYQHLKAKLRLIEDELIEQLNELKTICLEEAQITGQMPKEIYMTLLPGEKLPPLTKRVGTSFKLDDQLIENSNGTDRIQQLRADIQLHRKIVQAAERLANDKTTNKSVRRKRRKDLQAAALKLRGLEKGLYQLRMSTSKPDITSNEFNQFSRSRAGSGFSLNSLKSWPNFMGGGKTPKSCPTTPRGSIPDLSVDNENMLSDSKHLTDQFRREAQSTSGSSLPPAIPNRRPTISSLKDDRNQSTKKLGSSSTSDFPTYTNVGYKSSVHYNSAYRQQNYPTLGQYPVQRSKSVTTSSPPSASSTMFSIQKQSSEMGENQRLRVLPINSCSYLSPPRKTQSYFPSSLSNSAIGTSRISNANSPLSDNLSAIVSHMNQTANNLRQQQSYTRSSINKHPQPVVLRSNPPVNNFSTTSLDRRALRQQHDLASHTEIQPQRDSVSSGVSSASSSSNASPTSISRTTTFPVEYNYISRHHQPATRLGLSVSSSRVQPVISNNIAIKHTQIDPRMENLLASIHSRAPIQLNGVSENSPTNKKTTPSSNKKATIV